MNDRFKFRFWDKETQTMQKIPMVELRHRITLDKIFADDRVIFMQCTGLKDKNGKLIYEKDIIKCSHGCEFAIGVIEWDSKELQFALKIEDAFYSIRQETKFDIIEILGNIYENPELLEEV